MTQNKVIFYFRPLDKLKCHLNADTLDIFTYHWRRILSNVNFWTSTQQQSDIDKMMDSYFWHKILKEILQSHCYSLRQISEEIQVNPELIYKFYWARPSETRMPLAIGKKLLELHQKSRPDLQKEQYERLTQDSARASA